MLLDSNIIIYISKPEFAEMMDDLKAARPSASLISRIEAYDFHRITPQDMADLDDVFSWIEVLPVDDAIAARAIALRQQKNRCLGDSLIAATALIYRLPLCTRNKDDFKHIEGWRSSIRSRREISTIPPNYWNRKRHA